MFSLRDIVAIATKVEENGERTYRAAAAQVADERLAALLTRLADDEAAHAQWFADFGARAGQVEVDEQLADMGSSLLRGIVGTETFSLGEVDLTSLQGVKDVLEAAIELEEDTVIFYRMIAGFVADDATIEHLQAIIEEEQDHGRRLQEALETGQLPPRRESDGS
jgi:rubrerythrin